MASRAAWLSYVGGLKQEEIADRLNLSRVKVNRLIAYAHRRGLVRVFVDGSPAETVALEDRLVKGYGLDFCNVAPNVGEPDGEIPLRSLGVEGARFLHRRLERGGNPVIGFGHGRTLASVVSHLPRLPQRGVRYVSLLGSLTRNAAANPFDVIHRLAAQTGGESYFLPVPFFADSAADKAVFLAQKIVRDAFELARAAELVIIGIGEVTPSSHMVRTGMITRDEFAEVRELGAVGEVLGQFVDSEGRLVPAEINERSIGLGLGDLAGKFVVAVAGGRIKAAAIAAVLRTGIIRGLITDELTAGLLASEPVEKPKAAAAVTVASTVEVVR
ncbi:MAG: sugar-binding transcriptional regulator [Geminicoccaceae bacterium]